MMRTSRTWLRRSVPGRRRTPSTWRCARCPITGAGRLPSPACARLARTAPLTSRCWKTSSTTGADLRPVPRRHERTGRLMPPAGTASAGALDAALVPDRLCGLADDAVGTEGQVAVEGAGEPAVVGDRQH